MGNGTNDGGRGEERQQEDEDHCSDLVGFHGVSLSSRIPSTPLVLYCFRVCRDLKPANILIDHEGHVSISDLGLAVFFAPSQAKGASGSTAGLSSSNGGVAGLAATSTSLTGGASSSYAATASNPASPAAAAAGVDGGDNNIDGSAPMPGAPAQLAGPLQPGMASVTVSPFLPSPSSMLDMNGLAAITEQNTFSSLSAERVNSQSRSSATASSVSGAAAVAVGGAHGRPLAAAGNGASQRIGAASGLSPLGAPGRSQPIVASSPTTSIGGQRRASGQPAAAGTANTGLASSMPPSTTTGPQRSNSMTNTRAAAAGGTTTHNNKQKSGESTSSKPDSGRGGGHGSSGGLPRGHSGAKQPGPNSLARSLAEIDVAHAAARAGSLPYMTSPTTGNNNNSGSMMSPNSSSHGASFISANAAAAAAVRRRSSMPNALSHNRSAPGAVRPAGGSATGGLGLSSPNGSAVNMSLSGLGSPSTQDNMSGSRWDWDIGLSYTATEGAGVSACEEAGYIFGAQVRNAKSWGTWTISRSCVTTRVRVAVFRISCKASSCVAH